MIKVTVVFSDLSDWTVDPEVQNYEQWLTQHLEGLRNIRVESVMVDTHPRYKP